LAARVKKSGLIVCGNYGKNHRQYIMRGEEKLREKEDGKRRSEGGELLGESVWYKGRVGLETEGNRV